MEEKTTQNHLIHIEVVTTNIRKGKGLKINIVLMGVLNFKLKANSKRSLQCFLNAKVRFVHA